MILILCPRNSLSIPTKSILKEPWVNFPYKLFAEWSKYFPSPQWGWIGIMATLMLRGEEECTLGREADKGHSSRQAPVCPLLVFVLSSFLK